MTQRKTSIKENKLNTSLNNNEYGSKITAAVSKGHSSLLKGAMSHRNQIVPMSMIGSMTQTEDD